MYHFYNPRVTYALSVFDEIGQIELTHNATCCARAMAPTRYTTD